MRRIMALIFVPGIAVAGTSYDLTFRDLAQPASAPVVSRHFVQDGKVRADLVENQVLIFKDQAIYVVNNKARIVQVESNATRDQILARLADQVSQIRAKSAALPPDQRAKMEQGTSFLEDLAQNYKRILPRDYVATTQSEMIGGRKCRIWTQTQEGAKQLELCVVSVSTVRGGDEILAGMKMLGQYPVFGSLQALGVQFGEGEWWTGVESLGGLPVLIRVFEHGHVAYEVTITGEQQGVLSQSLFDIPDGYRQLGAGPTHEVTSAESNK
jgi:hypothetical protein